MFNTTIYIYTKVTLELGLRDKGVTYKRVLTESYLRVLKDSIVVINNSVSEDTIDKLVSNNNTVYINGEYYSNIGGCTIYRGINDLALGLSLRLGINILNGYYSDISELGLSLGTVASNNNNSRVELDTLRGLLDNKDREIVELKALIDSGVSLEATIQELNSSLDNKDSIINNLTEKLNNIGKLQDEIGSKDKDIQSLKDSLANKDSIINDLTEKLNGIGKLQDEIGSKDKDIQSLKDSLESEIVKLKDLLSSKESELRLVLDDKLKVDKALDGKEKELASKDINIVDLKDTISKLDGKLLELERELCVKDTELVSKDSIIQGLENDISNLGILTTKVSELEAELEVKIKDISNRDSIIQSLEVDLNNLRAMGSKADELVSLVQDKDKAISVLKDKVTKLECDISNLGEVRDKVNNLGVIIQSKDEVISDLTTQVNQLGVLITDKDNELGVLRGNLEVKEREVLSLSKVKSNGNTNVLKGAIKYTQKGRIINVYSLSSSGITSMVYTLGLELVKQGKKVILVDLDLTSPRLDTYLRVVPFNKALGYTNSLENTALNELRVKGSVIDINKLIGTALGGIDYLTGLYVNDTSGIEDINYTKLLNQLGTLYDYIIIDNGKLGNSLQYSLIEAIGRISYQNLIMVDYSKGTDLKLTMLKLGNMKGYSNTYILNKAIRVDLGNDAKVLANSKHHVFKYSQLLGVGAYKDDAESLENLVNGLLG